MANQNDQITLSKLELQQMIADAIASTRGNTPDFSELGKSIGSAVAAGMPAPPPRKVTFGEYQKRVHSSTHPDPKFPNGPLLNKECWINGDRAVTTSLNDREINFLNKLTHSGRYLDRLVEVIVGQDEIRIHWNNKTADQRFELGKHAKSFEDLMSQIIAVQVEEDKEEEVIQEEKLARRRTFGQSKATRDAIAKAEAYTSVE